MISVLCLRRWFGGLSGCGEVNGSFGDGVFYYPELRSFRSLMGISEICF